MNTASAPKYIGIAERTAYDRIVAVLFAIPAVQRVIMNLENLLIQDSPFNSVHRLNAILVKVKEPGHLSWVFSCIEDAYATGAYSREHRLSIDALTGGSSGGRGEVDLYLGKLKMKEHMLGPFMEKNTFNSCVKVQLRSVFGSHQTYRSSTVCYKFLAS